MAMQEGTDAVEKVDNPYYLLAIFDAVMSTMTKDNGKKVSIYHVCAIMPDHAPLVSPAHALLNSFTLTLSCVCHIFTHIMCIVHSLFAKDLDVQIHGHVQVSRPTPLLLWQGAIAIHLSCSGSTRCLPILHEDSGGGLSSLRHFQEVGQPSEFCGVHNAQNTGFDSSSVL